MAYGGPLRREGKLRSGNRTECLSQCNPVLLMSIVERVELIGLEVNVRK